ncbi:DUF2071 domain-containing protein [Brevundimonas sp. FT23028]|uniref:DUF2071 domain-containing protein n=1 Tax=Brevundimonas sp. FT23028 TaxID=3393748 RepID=UPI003B587925
MSSGGLDNHYRSPSRGLIGRIETAIANCEPLRILRRGTLSRLPFPVMASDVRSVIYANWLIPAHVAAELTPPGVELEVFDGKAVLTVLSYVHGGFGPVLAGPLRRLFPSPRQSNWRLYVRGIDGAAPDRATVLFLGNVFDSALYAIGTRLVSDVMLSHRAGTFVLDAASDRVRLVIGGAGSAPGLTLDAVQGEGDLPADFQAIFGSWPEAMAALTLQDRAIAPLARGTDLALADIDLPIDTAAIVPLEVTAFEPGAALNALGATGAPFCFLVPEVPFRVLGERILRRP